MGYGDKDDFKIKDIHYSNYSDGTTVPHVTVEVYRNGVYRGYVELHTHKVKDDSVSVGITSRLNTAARGITVRELLEFAEEDDATTE